MQAKHQSGSYHWRRVAADKVLVSWLPGQEVRQARKNYDKLMAKMASLVEYSEVGRGSPFMHAHACRSLHVSHRAR